MQAEEDDDAYADHLTLWRFLGDGPLPALKAHQATIAEVARVSLIRFRRQLLIPDTHAGRVCTRPEAREGEEGKGPRGGKFVGGGGDDDPLLCFAGGMV